MEAPVEHAVEPDPPPRPGTRTHPWCHAPSTSLYLGQDGRAAACAASQPFPLGSVVGRSLREIWAGVEAEGLRADHRAGRPGPACAMCVWQAAEAGPASAYARLFDHLELPGPAAPGPGPGWPRQIEFALSNTCNLQCVMCRGELSSSIRLHREHLPPVPAVYGDAFFEDLAEFLPHLHRAKFLGGEPFLVREHHRVWDMMIDAGLRTPCHVTTNGTQWNDRVERVLGHLPVSFSVSMDGITPSTVEGIRVGASLATILDNLDRICAYAGEQGTDVCLTFTLMRANWRELDDFLRFAEDRGVDVFVNVLTRPGHMSVYRLDERGTEEVVAGLERRDARARRDLHRTRPVWDEQLGRLRGRLAALRAGVVVDL